MHSNKTTAWSARYTNVSSQTDQSSLLQVSQAAPRILVRPRAHVLTVQSAYTGDSNYAHLGHRQGGLEKSDDDDSDSSSSDSSDKKKKKKKKKKKEKKKKKDKKKK